MAQIAKNTILFFLFFSLHSESGKKSISNYGEDFCYMFGLYSNSGTKSRNAFGVSLSGTNVIKQ